MINTTREIVLEVTGNPNDHRQILLYDKFDPIPLGGITLKSQGILSTYLFDYGNATYEVEKFFFYDPAGRQYEMRQGWFSGAFDKRYAAARFTSNQDRIKRFIIDDNFDFQKAYENDQIFFVSLGKNWESHGKPRAVIYVPMSYLNSAGFQVIKETKNYEYKIMTNLTLFTPTFQIWLTGETEDLVDVIKDDMVGQIKLCKTTEDLNAFLKRWQHRF